MKTTKIIPWLLVAAVSLLISGCSHGFLKEPETTAPILLSVAKWGPAVQGVQCRVRPAKRFWYEGKTLSFDVGFRNTGSRIFSLLSELPSSGRYPIRASRIRIDGRWYSRPQAAPVEAKTWLLGPGTELEDFSLSLSKETGLPLTPGYHTLEVAFSLEGLQIISNPVGIEIALLR